MLLVSVLTLAVFSDVLLVAEVVIVLVVIGDLVTTFAGVVATLEFELVTATGLLVAVFGVEVDWFLALFSSWSLICSISSGGIVKFWGGITAGVTAGVGVVDALFDTGAGFF
jgi:hypothetical protein